MQRALVTACIAVLCVSACRSKRQELSADAAAVAARPAFSVLAGSELRELEPALVAAAARAGLQLKLSYAGTLEAVDRINAGEQYDALLPPNGAYPMLSLQHRPLAREKLFYSRVALGVKERKLESLGWAARTPTWADVAHAAKAGQFRYGMTNPTSSNTGMSALFAVAAAAAKKTEDLTVADIDPSILKDFLTGQAITAGSSGWLADAFMKDPDTVDGLVNYESVLLRLNEQLKGGERLHVIYPQDGVITADYPLLLLHEEAHTPYQRLVAAWKALDFQRDALPAVYLRPSNPQAEASPRLPRAPVAELSFPRRLDVIDQVLMAYLNEWRRPSTSIFVLDTSGSMEGSRLRSLRESLKLLAGSQDTTGAARFAGFQTRERVVLITFADHVADPHAIHFDSGAVEAARDRVRSYADQLTTQGQTAIFSALARALEVARSEAANDPDRFVSIVLLTDGQNNAGLSYQEFREQFAREFASRNHPRVFTILFGESNVQEMRELAEWTGGRAFDARKASLLSAFKDIRGYQ